MDDDPLSSTFAALADPVRRQILSRLAAGETTLSELAGPLSITPQAVSKHLKVLERAGLITRGREAQRRPPRLREEPLQETVDWIERHRRAVRERYDRLDEVLQEIQRVQQKETDR